MLTAVEVRTGQGTLLALQLDDPSSGLVVADIEGLDPVKATLVSSSSAQSDGEQYHSARRESRNLKIKLELHPDYVNTSVRDLRNLLYSFFMPKRELMLRFIMSGDEDDLAVDIVGRVETCETPLFTQEPEVDISIMCFKPDFVDPEPVSVTGASTSTSTELIVDYPGTVETGMAFQFDINRAVSALTIYHRTPSASLYQMDFQAPLIAGDVLRISTIPGAKGATLLRQGSESSVLYAISPQSKWLELEQGPNGIRVFAEGAPFPYVLAYLTRYGGL